MSNKNHDNNHREKKPKKQPKQQTREANAGAKQHQHCAAETSQTTAKNNNTLRHPRQLIPTRTRNTEHGNLSASKLTVYLDL